MNLFHFPFRAMASANELQIFAATQQEADIAAELMIAEVRRIESKYSRYQPDSIVSRINAEAGKKEGIEVDSETAALLDYASTVFQESGGLFDITSGVLRRVWDFRAAKLPTTLQVEEILPLIGWEKVKWKNPYLHLPLSGMQLDFGGIGKEYAVDRAAGVALQHGVIAALINLGGDVRAVGTRPDGQAWNIGIVHPRKANAVICSVPLRAGSVATSGDYERFFDLDGKRYCHILNPRSGWPVSGFQSVTVCAASCLVAGSLATTAMLQGEILGGRFLKDSGVAALIVRSNGDLESL